MTAIKMDAHVATYQSEKEALVEVIFDLYKSAHGVKPRFLRHEEMSMQEVKDFLRDVADDCEQQMELEQAQQAEALSELEASIKSIMEVCRCDRYQAMTYLMDAEQDEFMDLEHFFWSQGLSFSDVDRLTAEYRAVAS